MPVTTPSAWIMLAAAALLTVLIHSLNLRPRKRMVVATLRPFQQPDKARWRPNPLTQWTLLVTRLVLLGLLLFLALHAFTGPSGSGFDGDVVAVTPDFSGDLDDVMSLPADHYIWLDQQFTRLPRAVGTTSSDPYARLLALDAVMAESASLTVVGTWYADQLPATLSRLSRDVLFVPDNSAKPVNALTPSSKPEAIVIDIDDPVDYARVRQAIEVWRSSQLINATVAIDRGDGTDALPVASYVIHDSLVRPSTATSSIALTSIEGAGEMNETELATALWLELTKEFRQRPSPSVRVASPTVQKRELPASRQLIEEHLPAAWLVTLVVLLLLERVLSLRGVRQ